jgi:hypothetical protein
VLAIEGNKIRLSRKAVLREQREKQEKEAGGSAPVASTGGNDEQS